MNSTEGKQIEAKIRLFLKSVSWIGQSGGNRKLSTGEVFRFIFVSEYEKCTEVQLSAQSCLLLFSK